MIYLKRNYSNQYNEKMKYKWNEIVENTFEHIEHVIEVRVESIKIKLDKLVKSFNNLKHLKPIDKKDFLISYHKNMKNKYIDYVKNHFDRI